MWDLGELVGNDPFWDPSSVAMLPSERIAREFGQTPLSRLSYHRSVIRKSGATLKLSQQLGILLWLNRNDLLSTKGEERLLFLQAKAPWGALEAGMAFAQRLSVEEKIVLDFYHWMVVLNCFPSTRGLRTFRARRIGIGYRDKGVLPSSSATARKRADSEAWVHRASLPTDLQAFIEGLPPNVQEGEWVDLPELVSVLCSGLSPEDLRLLLNP
jgi:hypothetical protein